MKKTIAQLENENRQLVDEIAKLTKEIENAKYYEDIRQKEKNELKKEADDLHSVLDVWGVPREYEQKEYSYSNIKQYSIQARFTLFIKTLLK